MKKLYTDKSTEADVPKLRFINMLRHFCLVMRHKARVFIHCSRCGMPLRGLVHDLSKFSPTEFFESARYYQGNRSPIGVCRRTVGVSRAWLHHKGRNKHHIEYWLDGDCKIQPVMPYKYAVECVCDKLAATKTYNHGSYTDDKAISHWHRYGNKVEGNPLTMLFIETVFSDLAEHSESYILNKRYMKATYKRVVTDALLSDASNAPRIKETAEYGENGN